MKVSKVVWYSHFGTSVFQFGYIDQIKHRLSNIAS